MRLLLIFQRTVLLLLGLHRLRLQSQLFLLLLEKWAKDPAAKKRLLDAVLLRDHGPVRTGERVVGPRVQPAIVPPLPEAGDESLFVAPETKSRA